MSTTENGLKATFLPTEFQQEVLMITVPNDYKEPVSPQISLSDFHNQLLLSPEIKNSLNGSNASLSDHMESQETSVRAPSIFIHDSKLCERNRTSAPDSSKSTKRKNNLSTDLALLISNAMPPALKSSSKLDSLSDDSLTSQLSTEKIQFKLQLASFYIVSKPYKLQFNPNCYIDHSILYASKQLAPRDH